MDLRTLSATVDLFANALEKIANETRATTKTAALAAGRGEMAFRAIGLMVEPLSDDKRRDLIAEVAEFPVADMLAEDTEEAAAAETGLRHARAELLELLTKGAN